MRTVILVQPENGLNEATYAPLGLISLAAYIRGYFDVKIIDLRFKSGHDLFDLIKRENPLAVGFSMLTGSCINQIISVAEEIKIKHPAVKIIVGGIHPTFFPAQTVAHYYIDFAIINEGEKPLLALLKAIENNLDFLSI
jgi:anaerobic magnesium-protoporphyrin IX monomethyl ester cyclase